MGFALAVLQLDVRKPGAYSDGWVHRCSPSCPSLTRRHQRANGNLPDAACAGSSLYSAPATRAPAMVPIRPKINHTRGTKRPTALHEACARFPGTFIISPRTTPTVSAVFGPGP